MGINPGVACQGEALGSVCSEARVTAPEICAGEKLEGCSLTVSQEGHDEGTSESFHAPMQNLRPHRCGHLPDLNYVFEMDPGAELSLQKPPNPESAQKRDSTWLQTPPAGGGRHPGAESGTGACAQTPLGFFWTWPWPSPDRKSHTTTVALQCSHGASCRCSCPNEGRRQECLMLPVTSSDTFHTRHKNTGLCSRQLLGV